MSTAEGAQLPEEEYAGPAEVLLDGEDGEPRGNRDGDPGDPGKEEALPVTVTLRGMFQPIDGRYRWYGRIDQDDRLDARVSSGGTVTLRTPHGSAPARLSDRDPWGRFRVTGTGAPPFPVPR
ncbi:MAG TPA: DUF4873 domain-containing protein [Nocardioidaceae bacterium]|nr:DUF4873 domain-containing protein [Nocardioidaceae bacterium]